MQRLRQRLRGERGSVAVEFALIVPVFLVLVYGGLSFGMAMSAKSVVTEAAADGARAAIGVPTASAAQVAKDYANQVLNNEGIAYKTYGSVNATLSTAGDGTCGPSLTAQCITVSISYPYSSHPALPNLPGFGLILPSTLNATYTVEVTP